MKKIIGIVLAVLLVAYAGVSVYFMLNVFPNTTYNGKDISYMSRDTLDRAYGDYSKEETLILEGKDGVNDKIKAVDIDFEQQVAEPIVLNQNFLAWPMSFFKPDAYTGEVTTNYDEAKLNQVIQALNIVSGTGVVPSQDAKVEKQGDNYVIVPEVYGTQVDQKVIKEAVIKGFSTGVKTLNLEAEKLYITPQIAKDEPALIEKAETMNRLANFKLTYDFSDRKEVLEGEELLTFYSENAEGKYVVDEEKVRQYVVNMAIEYDTYGATRTFQATGVGEVTVPGGIYGWQTDRDKTTQQLVDALNKGESVTMTPVYAIEGYERATNDIGNTYIEVDLNRQHMWLYKDGELLVQTDIISGNPNRAGRATPTGTGQIWSKETKRNLVGETYNAFVNYWMPFNWSGCGIHDAWWMNSFGGSVYLSQGSHGCLNTPPDMVPKFFDNVDVGTPVVIYDSSYQ